MLVSPILISHRGNVTGPNSDRENHPDYIDEAISAGYNVEIDVWRISDEMILGHDVPQYKIDMNFLFDRQDSLWCHAKNVEALSFMTVWEKLNCFWHQEDDVTLTSKGYIWTYPGKQLTENSICVKPSPANIPTLCAGICDDEIELIAERIEL
tara:strand:+ start:47 stop:505 length:459 start_codon:yes stop_codon:yes gene_type:complete